MDFKKFENRERRISLQCPTCGGDQFEYDAGVPKNAALFTCASCGREIQREDLLDENQELISNHAQDFGKEVSNEILKEFKSNLKKTFASSKYIKIK